MLLRLLVLVLVTACRPKSSSVDSGNAVPTVVQLELSAVRYEGRELSGTIRVVNRTKSPQWMNARLAINAAEEPPPYRDVWFLIRNEQGTTVQNDCMVTRGGAENSDYAVLKPGKDVSRAFSLNCFELTPGEYRIEAHYRDGNATPPPAPAGTVRLAGELISARVGLTVKR